MLFSNADHLSTQSTLSPELQAMNWSTELVSPWGKEDFLFPQPFVPWFLQSLRAKGERCCSIISQAPGPRPQFGENSSSPLALAVRSAHSSWGLGPPAGFRIWAGHQQHPLPITPPCYCPLSSCCQINTRVFCVNRYHIFGGPMKSEGPDSTSQPLLEKMGFLGSGGGGRTLFEVHIVLSQDVFKFFGTFAS